MDALVTKDSRVSNISRIPVTPERTRFYRNLYNSQPSEGDFSGLSEIGTGSMVRVFGNQRSSERSPFVALRVEDTMWDPESVQSVVGIYDRLWDYHNQNPQSHGKLLLPTKYYHSPEEGLFVLNFPRVDGTLKQFLKPEITSGERFELISQVAELTDIAHDAGVLHRDIHSDNFFYTKGLRRTPHLMIGDFSKSELIDNIEADILQSELRTERDNAAALICYIATSQTFDEYEYYFTHDRYLEEIEHKGGTDALNLVKEFVNAEGLPSVSEFAEKLLKLLSRHET